MKISGTNTIPFPVDQVWDALLDPAVLVRTLPGCERLVATEEHRYAMTVTAGVAAIRGTYDGTCAMPPWICPSTIIGLIRLPQSCTTAYLRIVTSAVSGSVSTITACMPLANVDRSGE